MLVIPGAKVPLLFFHEHGSGAGGEGGKFRPGCGVVLEIFILTGAELVISVLFSVIFSHQDSQGFGLLMLCSALCSGLVCLSRKSVDTD
mgnify:CR=1 FL=1